MKLKSFVLAAALLVSTSAFAGEQVLTNGFGKNWFVGLGGGINLIHSEYCLDEGHVINPYFDVNFGKWVTPDFGVQFDVYGLNVLGPGEISHRHIEFSANLLWDVTATISKTYKEKRILSVVPYISAAYFAGEKWGAGAGLGLLLPIRIANGLYVTPDFRAIVSSDGITFDGPITLGRAGIVSATLGLQYRFGKQKGFTTASEFVAPYVLAAAEAEAARQEAEAKIAQLTAENEAAAKANAQLTAENEAMAHELATTAARNKAIVNNLMATTSCVYFEIGQATLSVKELAHLDYIVKTKVAQGKELTFTIAGNADKNTGTKARNRQLSKQRANYIVKLLTTKYGLCKDQFEVVINGANNYTKVIELNRAVLIDAK